MAPTTESLIDIGLDHLGRFAFFTRDNPFLSSRATLELPPSDRRILTELFRWLAVGRRLETV